MTCTQIDEFLDDAASSRVAAFPGWVDEHCRRCERCRSLLELLRSSKTPEMPASGGLPQQVEQTVLRSLEAVSPLPPARMFVMVFLGVFGLLAVGGISLIGAAATRAMSTWRSLGWERSLEQVQSSLRLPNCWPAFDATCSRCRSSCAPHLTHVLPTQLTFARTSVWASGTAGSIHQATSA